ncbi:hypothetical protein D0Y65_049019, partial [Glycine soja]
QAFDNALKQNLWAIGASSHIISLMTFKSSTNSLSCPILQVEFCKAGTSIANLECAILPPSSNKKAIPLDATIKTICPFERNVEDSVIRIKVL